MNSKEWLLLFLRMVGVLGIIFIVRHALWVVPTLTVPPALASKWGIGALVGIYLIRGAPLLLKFAFPQKPASPA